MLDYLTRQREQPDPALLDELDWSDQQFQDFVDRWNRARDLAAEGNEQDRLRWQEQLNALGLNPQNLRLRDGRAADDQFQQMRDAGGRIRPPASLRKQWDAFRRAMQQSR